jgi:urease accessory protein
VTRALLLAFQHADSAFPSGSFAFSNGLEGLLRQGWPLDRNGLAGTLKMILRHRWATAERVAVVRAHRTAHDLTQLTQLDSEVEASSICEPLRTGSRRNGAAFIASHVRYGTPGAQALREAIGSGMTPGHLAVAQGFAWGSLGIAEAISIAMSGYATVSGLVTAAIRLGQIGALAAQPIFAEALDCVADLAAAPVRDDEPLSSFVPFLEVCAVKQTTAELRLFAT